MPRLASLLVLFGLVIGCSIDGVGSSATPAAPDISARRGSSERARRVADPLVAGLALNPSGRHTGCRPTLDPDGYLYVGTGDSAMAAVSRDRTRFGGKVLRIDLATGGPAPGNPFAGSVNPAERLVFSYGHRNVQGVTVQPSTRRLFAAEHGPDVDDEINLLRASANYGWDPSRGSTGNGYDENVPMTDLARFPDAVPAVWSEPFAAARRHLRQTSRRAGRGRRRAVCHHQQRRRRQGAPSRTSHLRRAGSHPEAGRVTIPTSPHRRTRPDRGDAG